MITKEKIKIYQSVGGDIDAFTRIESKNCKNDMTEDDFILLEELLQKTTLLKSGMLSKEYGEEVEEQLNNSTDCEDTKQKIKKLA